MLLLSAKGAREGPRADFSSILASILVSLRGLLEALGALWEASGKLWVPKWRPEATKEGTEDLQGRFGDISKTFVFIRGNMVFGGLGGIRRHVEGIQEAFEGFWEHLEASGGI